MRWQILVLTFCFVFCAQSIHADEITFTNGDRLTGKITHLMEGKMLFKSDAIGDVTIDISKPPGKVYKC